MVVDNQGLSLSNLNVNSPVRHIFVSGNNFSMEDLSYQLSNPNTF